jgi:hypothetical protein
MLSRLFNIRIWCVGLRADRFQYQLKICNRTERRSRLVLLPQPKSITAFWAGGSRIKNL